MLCGRLMRRLHRKKYKGSNYRVGSIGWTQKHIDLAPASNLVGHAICRYATRQ